MNAIRAGDVVAGRFEVERPAGAGAMGEVFRAKDLEKGGPVALKVLRLGSEASVDRFAREAHVLEDLDHEAIVRYLAHGVTGDGRPYIAMAWLEGMDLARRLEDGPLGVADAVLLGRRAAEALAFAHARGIVHRDIKPANIFLRDGRVERTTVLDFGIARKSGLSTLTQADVLLGTPSYMAPEQARGGGNVDARADVYALGSVLFKCLTGEVPFAGGDLVALLGRVVFEQPRRASALRPDVPPVLDELVAAMLSKDPASRPASGEDLVLRLAHAAGSLAVARVGPRRAGFLAAEPLPAGDPAGQLDSGSFAATAGAIEVSLARAVETPRPLLGVATPFLGRAHELSALRAAFEACVRDSSARYFLVTGAAGLGKSRLRIEFVAEVCRTRPATRIWMGRGDPRRKGSPFSLLTQAMRVATKVHDGEPLALRQEKLRAEIARVLPPGEVPRVANFLGHLVGTPPAGEADTALLAAQTDPVLMGDQVRRAAEDFVAASCEGAPVVLVLENLHWGDLSTVQFIDAALRNLRHLPLMVLAVGRHEVREAFPKLWQERRGVELPLRELPRSACRSLVTGALGPGAAPSSAAVERLVERSGGNAFYLEELIRSAAEGKGDAVPPTLVAMVQARIGRLEAGPRRVLGAASVFGRVFWQDGVDALLREDVGTLAAGTALGPAAYRAPRSRALDALVDQEILVRRPESKLAGQEELAFRNELFEQAAYAMLTPADKELGHRLAAEWLERAGESDALVLAAHFERGGRPARAATCYARAGEVLLEGNDLAAAIATADRGLACGAEGAARAALRLVQAEAHHWRGDAARTESAALEAIVNLPRGEGPWCTALGYVASASSRAGDDEGLKAHAELVHELLGEGVRHPALLVAASRVVAGLVFAGKYEDAERLLAHAREAGRLLFPAHPAVAARVEYAQALCASVVGDLATHLELSSSAAARFESIGDLRNACFQLVAVGNGWKELGANERACGALTSALASADRMGLGGIGAAAHANLAVVLARQGALERARSEARLAVSASEAQGDVRMLGGARAYLASVLALSGDLEGAERESRLSVEELSGHAPTRCLALGVHAEVRLAQGDLEGALAASAEAVSLLDALGGVEEGEATARLAHARSLRALGKGEAATEAIRVARRRIEERASRIRDAELRESFLRHVPEHAATLDLAAEDPVILSEAKDPPQTTRAGRA